MNLTMSQIRFKYHQIEQITVCMNMFIPHEISMTMEGNWYEEMTSIFGSKHSVFPTSFEMQNYEILLKEILRLRICL